MAQNIAMEQQPIPNGQIVGTGMSAPDLSSFTHQVSTAPGDTTSSLLANLTSSGSLSSVGLLPNVAPSGSIANVGLLGDAQLTLPSIPQTTALPLACAMPPAMGSMPVGGLCCGTLFHVAEGGTYGFIKPDAGGADVFAMPPLSGFPPSGSRVVCSLMIDQNLPGKLRAENVQLESNLASVGQQVGTQPNLTNDALAGFGSLPTPGVNLLTHLQPQTHIITPQLADSAVMSIASPPTNAQSLLASVTAAAETQARAAAAVDLASLTTLLAAADPTVQALLTQQLLAGAALQGLQGLSASTGAPVAVDTNGRQGGTMRHIQTDGKFGFIKPDNGGPDILALPPSSGFPTIGARVTFDIIADDKTGRPKADNLQVVDEVGTIAQLGVGGFGPALLAATSAALRSAPFPAAATATPRQQGPVTQPGDRILYGTISKVNEKFAFVKQDSGEADMFVIPPACEAFGRELPPVGTRVQYKVILDAKSGRPRADSVGPSLAPSMG